MSGLLTPETAPAPVVIKLGGAAIDAPNDSTDLFAMLARLHEVHPGGLVLVHGGGAAIDRHLKRCGLASKRRDGIRLTPADHIDDVVAILAGTVNKRLVGRLQAHGARAVGLCLADGQFARTSKATTYDFDPGRVGEINDGEPQVVRTLLADGFLPVFSSIGLDENGSALNVNADDAAAGVAQLLNAFSLVFLTDVPGVLDQHGQVLGELRSIEIEQRIASREITGGMIAKVRGAVRAAGTAGLPVTIASWREPCALTRLIRGQSLGTRVLPYVDVDRPDVHRCA